MVEIDSGHTRMGGPIGKIYGLTLFCKCLMALLVTRALCIAHELDPTLLEIYTKINNPTYYTKTLNVVASNRGHVTCGPKEHHNCIHLITMCPSK